MTETKKQPFNFFFYYELDTGLKHNALLVGGDPTTASPLHLQIGIKEVEKILIRPLPGVTTASSSNYHFKLQFDTAKLLEPEQITVDSDDWDLQVEGGTILYLLWKQKEVTIDKDHPIELMLNGVMATLEPTQQNTTTTNVTLSWEFKRDNITIIEVTSTAPGETDPYEKTFTQTLEMTQQGPALPVYVGFFSSNRVLNTNNQENELRLRITNMSNSSISFSHHYSPANRSQLVVALEVGDANTFPWALGTKDQVNDVDVSIDGDWEFDPANPKENGKMLEWTFTPKSANVVLDSQDTVVIKLSKIVTAHPTGMANLYLRSQYVSGYGDSEFICQIEKAPLVYPDKNVGIGTTTPTAKLEINGTGNTFLSGNGTANQVIIQDGNLGIGVTNPTAKLQIDGTGITFLSDNGELTPVIHDSNIGIGTTNPTAKLQINGTGNTFLNGNNTTEKVIIEDGNLGVGIAYPKGKLDVHKSIKIKGEPAMESEEHHFSIENDYYVTTNPHNKWNAFIGGSRVLIFKQVNIQVSEDNDNQWKILATLYFGKQAKAKVLFIRKEFFE